MEWRRRAVAALEENAPRWMAGVALLVFATPMCSPSAGPQARGDGAGSTGSSVAGAPGAGAAAGGVPQGGATPVAGAGRPGGNAGSGALSGSQSDGGAGTDHGPDAGGAPGDDDEGQECQPAAIPACDAEPPDPGSVRAWRGSGPLSADPRHRGRDQFLTPGDPQWLIARFAYGLLDLPLTGEDVDVYLLRGCASTWEKLGTARTTNPDQHAEVEGVSDNGGRVYFEVPVAMKLAPGRHRVRFVVAGDLSATEAFIEVVPDGMPLFVSDVDGTLTTDENAEFTALLTGMIPDSNADAAAALGALAAKGYRPLYLTARPEWLVERTRAFLEVEGFPPGILHTTVHGTGAPGNAAATFKTVELEALAKKGLRPSYVFGNTETDAEAYDNAMVEPVDHRIFYRFTDAMYSGRRIDAYADLVPEFRALDAICP